MHVRRRIETPRTASKPGYPFDSGNSVEATDLPITRCPVFRSRDSNSGFRMELENLLGGDNGKGASGKPRGRKHGSTGHGRTASWPIPPGRLFVSGSWDYLRFHSFTDSIAITLPTAAFRPEPGSQAEKLLRLYPPPAIASSSRGDDHGFAAILARSTTGPCAPGLLAGRWPGSFHGKGGRFPAKRAGFRVDSLSAILDAAGREFAGAGRDPDFRFADRPSCRN
jgi:hypothetical protein